jgi:hypothetical protein
MLGKRQQYVVLPKFILFWLLPVASPVRFPFLVWLFSLPRASFTPQVFHPWNFVLVDAAFESSTHSLCLSFIDTQGPSFPLPHMPHSENKGVDGGRAGAQAGTADVMLKFKEKSLGFR